MNIEFRKIQDESKFKKLNKKTENPKNRFENYIIKIINALAK